MISLRTYRVTTDWFLLSRFDTWHKRLGHIGKENLIKTLQEAEITITSKDEWMTCIDCIQANKSQNYGTNDRATDDGPLRLDWDIVELTPESAGGAKYACAYITSRGRWIEARVLQAKSEQAEMVVQVVNQLENEHDLKFKILRADRAKESMSGRLYQWCREKGLTQRSEIIQ